MSILGAHQSIAGGYYRSAEIAQAMGCDCVQLFTKNNNQWRAKEISDDDAARFRQTLTDTGVRHPLSHASYLINLGTPDPELWKKSVDSFVVELQRAERLGIPYVVVHPGSFTTGTAEQGLQLIIQAVDEAHGQTRGMAVQPLLETTAGQGSCLGHRFEHLAEIIGGVREPERVGVCVDTCHIFAAGYPLATKKEYTATIKQMDDSFGVSKIKAWHLNDSKKPLGSRVDRHEHIGRGCLGLDPFRWLLNDPRFRKIPMYLETEKGIVDGEEMDVVNLRTLRGLLAE